MNPINAIEFLNLINAIATPNGVRMHLVGAANHMLTANEAINLRGMSFEHPVIISNVTFEEYVDFSEWRCKASLRIENCRFKKGLRLADTKVEGLCSLKDSWFQDNERCWFDFRRMHVEGLLDCTRIIATACLDFENLFAGDDVWFYSAQLESVLNTTADSNSDDDDSILEVARSFWTEDADKDYCEYLQNIALHLSGGESCKDLCFQEKCNCTFRCWGQVNIRATVGGSVYFDNAFISTHQIIIALDMISATIGGCIYVRDGSTIIGQVDIRANVGDQVNFNNATIISERDLTAIDAASAQIKGAFNIRNKSLICGAVSLTACNCGEIDIAESKIQHKLSGIGLELRAAIVDRSVYLRESRIHGQLDVRAQIGGNFEVTKSEINSAYSAIVMHKAIVQGSIHVLENTIVHGEVDIRASIGGDVRLKACEITVNGHANALLLDSAEIAGSLILDNSKLTGKLMLRAVVNGEIAISYSIINTISITHTSAARLTINFNEQLRLHSLPRLIDLTGSKLGSILFRGCLSDGDPPLLVVENLKFTTIDCSKLVFHRNAQKPSDNDYLRYRIWIATVTALLMLSGLSSSWLILPLLFYAQYTVFLWAQLAHRKNHIPSLRAPFKAVAKFYQLLFSGWRWPVHIAEGEPGNQLLNHLEQTYPFSRGYYLQIERMLRENGDDETADEVFHMRRRRESEPAWQPMFALANPPQSPVATQKIDFLSTLRYLLQSASNLLPSNEPRRKAFVGVANTQDPPISEQRESPSSGARLWSRLVDFVMGYGVRTHRLVHIYILFFFINAAVFLNERSVERPISFIQQRSDGPLWGKAIPEPADVPWKQKNPWPSDGGIAEDWSTGHAVFMALRVQIPALNLVAENDWSPATRPMQECLGIVSYADFASLMMIANIILIPLIIAGATGYLKKST